MRDGERISRIASLITQIWEQQKGTSFLQLIETLKSDYLIQTTGSMDKESLIKDDEFERFLAEHLNDLIGENQRD
ncbi:hypothetical protein [Bacillus haynesii]|uniref:hypothetical protein n=1 Tax=Bacillus haynesii TaxID=1925021 RepID=UPI00227FC555|nr:hypothetical protein [Bacillus haynesii]MCY9156279.1 hypothetical protein [Bacillus haynesii]MCY9450364.1 hypothetical protein [Bacillus haynesii]